MRGFGSATRLSYFLQAGGVFCEGEQRPGSGAHVVDECEPVVLFAGYLLEGTGKEMFVRREEGVGLDLLVDERQVEFVGLLKESRVELAAADDEYPLLTLNGCQCHLDGRVRLNPGDRP